LAAIKCDGASGAKISPLDEFHTFGAIDELCSPIRTFNFALMNAKLANLICPRAAASGACDREMAAAPTTTDQRLFQPFLSNLLSATIDYLIGKRGIVSLAPPLALCPTLIMTPAGRKMIGIICPALNHQSPLFHPPSLKYIDEKFAIDFYVLLLVDSKPL